MLCSTYVFRPADVAGALRALAGLPTVMVDDAEVVASALDFADKGMDLDALHLGKSARCEGFTTFDRKFVKTAKAGHEGCWRHDNALRRGLSKQSPQSRQGHQGGLGIGLALVHSSSLTTQRRRKSN